MSSHRRTFRPNRSYSSSATADFLNSARCYAQPQQRAFSPVMDRTFDPTRVYRNEIAGGKMSHTYESLVRNIFRPEQSQQEGSAFLPPSFAPPSAQFTKSEAKNEQKTAQMGGVPSPIVRMTAGQKIMASQERPRISAAAMKRIEEQLGRDALDDSNDDDLWKSPLDEIYAELGIDSSSAAASSMFAPAPFHSALSSAYTSPSSSFSRRPAPGLVSEYSVYSPKSSAEYSQLANSTPPAQGSSRSSALGTYRLGASSSIRSAPIETTFREKSDAEWRKNNRQTLVDYKDFPSSPLSPYMYKGSVQHQDSRIVGSNFVQVTTRPRDRFLEKVDQTLAEIRSSPRYSSS